MTLEETFTNIGWLTNERKLQPANISVSSNVLSLAVEKYRDVIESLTVLNDETFVSDSMTSLDTTSLE